MLYMYCTCTYIVHTHAQNIVYIDITLQKCTGTSVLVYYIVCSTGTGTSTGTSIGTGTGLQVYRFTVLHVQY